MNSRYLYHHYYCFVTIRVKRVRSFYIKLENIMTINDNWHKRSSSVMQSLETHLKLLPTKKDTHDTYIHWIHLFTKRCVRWSWSGELLMRLAACCFVFIFFIISRVAQKEGHTHQISLKLANKQFTMTDHKSCFLTPTTRFAHIYAVSHSACLRFSWWCNSRLHNALWKLFCGHAQIIHVYIQHSTR